METDSIPLDEQLCYTLYATSMAINRAYKPLLDELGITYPQYLVLSCLSEEDGRTITAIADRLALEPSTITPLVKRLERCGLVERRRNPNDERQVHVSLTGKGRDLHAKSACLTAALLERSGMTPKGLIALNRQIQALRDSVANPT
jgi:DNA-binding MarR family transcriptional regulator